VKSPPPRSHESPGCPQKGGKTGGVQTLQRCWGEGPEKKKSRVWGAGKVAVLWGNTHEKTIKACEWPDRRDKAAVHGCGTAPLDP